MPRIAAPVKDAVRSTLATWGRSTAGLRVLPDFLILGAQRCGTTSLYKYLVRHPGVVAPPLGKGAHFFDTNYCRGEDWYRGHFPTRLLRAHGRPGGPRLTGEGSPYYVFHPDVPRRVAQLLPAAKLIVMLRDPVKRAWSQYWHEVARGFESLPFEEALGQESARLAGEEQRLLSEPGYRSLEHQHHSYLARGRYAEQLERWLEHFPSEQLLVVSSERFFAAPEPEYHRVLRFLGLSLVSLPEYAAHNPRSYAPIPPQLRTRLEQEFAAPNARLRDLLGAEFPWDGMGEDG
jgi:hypothetical protein